MMKRISVGDVGDDVNSSTNKSYEELEEDVARHASDESEARRWLRERIMHRVVSRILDDVKNGQRLMMINIKNQEKRVIKTSDDTQLHGKINKCNNNEEKGVVQVKNPKHVVQEKEEEEDDDDYEESLKKQGESSGDFCVPPKKRVRFNKEVKLSGIVKRCKSDNNNKIKRQKFVNNGKKRFEDVGIEPPPPLPNKLKKHIEENGGSDIKLVIMKRIYAADLITRNNRISIPKNQIRDDSFLTEEEKEFIKHEIERSSCDRDSNNNDTKKKKTDLDKEGLVIKLIDPSMEETEQHLKTYNTNSLSHVVTNSWNPVVERHKHVLQIGAIVQIWSFRRRPLTLEEQSKRYFVHKKTPLMNTNLSLVLVIVDGKGNHDGASTSGCGESKIPSPDSTVTDQGGNS